MDAASPRSILSDCNNFNSVCSAVNNVTTYTWHYRPSHLSVQKLEMMKDQLNLTCNGYTNKCSIPCFIYPLAKQMRVPFVSNKHLSHTTYDLIHCNTWGPYHAPTHEGHKFFLILVDEYMLHMGLSYDR